MARRWNDHDDWGGPTPPSRSTRLKRIVTFSVIGAVVVYGLGVWSGVELSASSSGSLMSSNLGASSQLGSVNPSTFTPGISGGNMITNIYNNVKRSIFTITAVTPSTSKDGGEEDVGTGFLIDQNGDIATNAHVVNGQSTVTVTQGNQTFKGIVVGADTLDDLAIVHIDAPPDLAPLPLGTAKTLQPGDFVMAIGNPFQLTESVSSGIISGLNRTMPEQSGHILSGLVQTDAALNPGNSGGPLLNSAGQVVGINTAIESPVEGSVGIGFAIPIDEFIHVEKDLLAGKQIGHPWLGIEGWDIDQIVQQELQLPVSSGIYVVSVDKNSPAAKAGLQGDSSPKVSQLDNADNPSQLLNRDGDIIIAENGKPVGSIEDLSQMISGDSPGTTIQLTILRKGVKKTVSVTLGNWPANGS